jgi:hypothetical protein
LPAVRISTSEHDGQSIQHVELISNLMRYKQPSWHTSRSSTKPAQSRPCPIKITERRKLTHGACAASPRDFVQQ